MPLWLRLALFGAFGGILPEIILLYSKRWTSPDLPFDDWHYVALTVLYMGGAAVVASVFPYRKGPSPWKAIVVGISLPVIVSSIATTAKAVIEESTNQIFIGRGGESVGVETTASFLDLLSFL